MISPVVQSFLMAEDPESSAAGIGLNYSAMHVGVGLGTAIGGVAVDLGRLEALPWIGGILAAFSVGLSLLAARKRLEQCQEARY